MKTPSKIKDNFWPRVFSDFFESENLPDWSKRFYDWEEKYQIPSVNVNENEKEFQLEVAAPGFDKNDFKIDFSKGILTLMAEKEEKKEDEKGEMKRKEFSYAAIKRSFNLPEIIDEEGINAKYENGILHIHLPKVSEVEAPPAKKIKVG
ncbi:Hsp20/alpha crystallin family protein [Cyclobacterium salsum]|uniref:Hsp20/alpha crystallin family protein n=1 Tax=Cyclobacterium salsum TaxID=2666329 RepID=UPI0013907E43|nr:Hsp20/alpha crystallin family protein [Cyclobacterium salsum]